MYCFPPDPPYRSGTSINFFLWGEGEVHFSLLGWGKRFFKGGVFLGGWVWEEKELLKWGWGVKYNENC
jgi:hypothetical protein